MKISPKQFLKTRRPSQFSDSNIVSETTIDRLKLELYLDTLSSRSQELEFEGFAKSLCQIEICPNLIPHTGPSGGGDSKVDSETYPVSDSTTLSWFIGIGNKAANERWAFAFSIKKDWKPKVEEDIKKIHETGRDYKVAYFVSNQYIPDKKRAEVEDILRNTYGIDVRILDRNWILDKVFKNKREDIVKKELHVPIIEEIKTRKGPLDTQREEDLIALDKEIESRISEGKIDASTIENALRSAILAREIEKPRIEIDGRFERAERLAQEYGNQYHQFDVSYQYAWTTFWWHEDFPTYIDLYKKVEEKALNTDNVYNLERLTNLWYGLNNLHNQDKKLVEVSFLTASTKNLKEKLGQLALAREEKPSISLYAKSLLLQIELAEKRFSCEDIEQTLTELTNVVKESKHLIGFPLKPLVQVLTEISSALEDSPTYKSLFKTILEVTEERDGELASAKLILDRGEKLMLLERPHEAIQELGTALHKLYKNESKDDAVRALFLIGVAYEQVGLFWAARGALLSAASLATSDFWNYGDINTMQAACYKRLKWLELRLGRLPQALDWHRLDFTTRNILASKGFRRDGLVEQVNQFDIALGIVFLRADLSTLKTLEYLPDTLEEIGLDFSPIALLYALGLQDQLPLDFTSVIPPVEMDDFFTQWAKQYSAEYLPQTLIPTEGKSITLISHVLGCTILVNTDNQSPCLEVAESILSAIESFLSTGTLRHAAAHESVVEINIDNQAKNELIEFTVEDGGDNPIINVYCKNFNPHSVSHADQNKLQDLIFKLMVETTARFVMFRDNEKDLKEIMQDERAPERALSFSSSFVTLGNVLGHKPKTQIFAWVNDKKRRYELVRTEPLMFPEIAPKAHDIARIEDDPLSHAKHTDLQTISIIRNVLWDQAKWTGVGYMVMPGDQAPPILAILFSNIDAGKKIFEGWKKKFSAKDADEEIRVTIVKGIDKDNALHYKVGIGSSMTALEKEREKNSPRFFTASTRIHVMTPQTLQNLDNFRASYNRFGYYLLAPGYIGEDGLPEILIKHGVVKKEINFKEAWEIGPDDMDSVLVSSDDKPIIPTGVQNPPVLELLKSRENSSPRKLKK